jgi:hypothetical protein
METKYETLDEETTFISVANNLNNLNNLENTSNSKTNTNETTNQPTTSTADHHYHETSSSSFNGENKHHILNPFQNFYHHALTNTHRNYSDNVLNDYTSESLLLFTKEGNFFKVKDILDNTITNKLNNETILNRRSSVYNTITETTAASKKKRIDLEITDESKQTPLIIACRQNTPEIAHILLKHGAKVNASDLDSWTPLMNATKNGNAELVEELLSYKANIEDRDMGGFTPLMWACYKNHPKVVRILLNNGAMPNTLCKVLTKFN